MYIIYRFLCFLGKHMPLPILYLIARVIAELRFIFFHHLKRNVKSNLRIILSHREQTRGTSFTEEDVEKLAKKTFLNFAKCLADFSSLPRWTHERIKEKVVIENINLLDEGLSAGKGVIALTAHTGNWELAGITTAMTGYRVSAISIPYKNPSITRIYTNMRQSKGVSVILTGSSPKGILKALRQNRVLAVLGDRTFTEKGAKTAFMGKQAVLPRGPATLAVKTGARVVAGFFMLDGNNYRFFFRDIPSPPESLSDEEKISFLFSEGARAIEKVIMSYPDQWFNFDPMKLA